MRGKKVLWFNILKLNQEEIDNLNTPVSIKEIVTVKKKS